MCNWCSFNVVVIIVIFAVKMIIIKFKCKFLCTYRAVWLCSFSLTSGSASSSSAHHVWPIYCVYGSHTGYSFYVHFHSFIRFFRGGGSWTEINGVYCTVTIPQAHNTCKSFIFKLNKRCAAVCTISQFRPSERMVEWLPLSPSPTTMKTNSVCFCKTISFIKLKWIYAN